MLSAPPARFLTASAASRKSRESRSACSPIPTGSPSATIARSTSDWSGGWVSRRRCPPPGASRADPATRFSCRGLLPGTGRPAGSPCGSFAIRSEASPSWRKSAGAFAADLPALLRTHPRIESRSRDGPLPWRRPHRLNRGVFPLFCALDFLFDDQPGDDEGSDQIVRHVEVGEVEECPADGVADDAHLD